MSCHSILCYVPQVFTTKVVDAGTPEEHVQVTRRELRLFGHKEKSRREKYKGEGRCAEEPARAIRPSHACTSAAVGRRWCADLPATPCCPPPGDTIHSLLTSSGDHYQNFQTRIMWVFR